MAKYNITNLNYIATGNNRSFLNMDIVLDYEIYDYIHLLCAETQSSGYVTLGDAKTETNLCALHHDIGTEHGNGYWYPNKYIQHGESDMMPLSKEGFYEAIILNEQQEHYIETDPSNRKYIRLYLSCCTIEMKNKIAEFNRNRETFNCTYLLDNAMNDKNVIQSQSSLAKNMYDIRDVTIQKQGTHESKNTELYNTSYHHDIYVPTMLEHPIGFCQANLNNEYLNDAVLITQNTQQSPYDLKTTLLSTRGDYTTDTFYNSNIEPNNDKTYTYCTKTEREDFGYSLTPRRNYMNISKAYIVDLPVNSALVPGQAHANDVADYDDGQIYYLRLHTTKSAFNPQYSMEMSSTTSLANARTYCGIGTSGGRPYLKFYDDSTYVALSSDGKKLDHVTVRRANSKSGSFTDQTTTPYQKIEFLYPVDYANEAKHKSNVFTIGILSTNIGTLAQQINDKIEDGDDTDYDRELLDKLTTLSVDITHAIQDIVEHITPANTQLFDVYFKED